MIYQPVLRNPKFAHTFAHFMRFMCDSCVNHVPAIENHSQMIHKTIDDLQGDLQSDSRGGT